MQLCLRRADRHAELAADLFVLPAFDIMQHEHGPCARRQLRHRLLEIGALAGAERRQRLTGCLEHIVVGGIFRIA